MTQAYVSIIGMNANDFLKQDIFFVVTTAAVIVFTIFGIIIAIYIMRLLRKIDEVVNLVKEQLEQVKNTAKFFRTLLTKIKRKA